MMNKTIRTKIKLFAIVILGTSLIIIIVAVVPVRKMQIELIIEARFLSFRLEEPQALFRSLHVNELVLTGLESVDVEYGEFKYSTSSNVEEPYEVNLEVVDERAEPETPNITLAIDASPKDSIVTLEYGGASRYYSLSLRDFGAPIQVGAGEDTRLVLNDEQVHPPQRIKPSLSIQTSRDVEAGFRLANMSTAEIGQVRVSLLDFAKIEQGPGPDVGFAKVVSGIMSGGLTFNSLDEKQIVLKEGDILKMEIDSGSLRNVSLKPNHIDVRFHGAVSDVEVTVAGHTRRLMPTLLEWALSNQKLALIWGTTVYCLSILIGAYTFFKRGA